MNDQKNNRTLWLHLRLSPEEYERLYKGFSKTTCRKISEYSRKILLGKPMVATYRNQSLDDFMTEMIRLRSELNSIGNNFNQAVKKLHSMRQEDEIRGSCISHEAVQQTLVSKVEQIKSCINKIADLWLQSSKQDIP